MKPIAHLSKNPISLLKTQKRVLRLSAVVLCACFLHLFLGCYYYRVNEVSQDRQRELMMSIQEFNETEKYVIVHQNMVSRHLTNAIVDEATLELRGIPKALSAEHSYKDYPEVGKTYRYKNNRQNPLNEIHLYLNSQPEIQLDQEVVIPFESIEKLGISERNTGRTVMDVVGISLGVIALIGIIVALTKSSCPFVYVDTGDALVFQGELYPGSIIENAQRPDYLRLPDIREQDGHYSLEITNELREVQHTDEAVLEIVDHPSGVTVLSDPSGNLLSISKPKPPIKAVADQKTDIRRAVSEADDLYAGFDSPLTASDGTRSIDLEFDNTDRANTGKLVLSLKNAYWLDYAMGCIYKKFGDYYPEFQRKQQEVSMEEAYRWRTDQSLPLSVYLKTSAGWELQHEINAVGPIKYRDIALRIDLENAAEGPVQIRLKTGFMFWEVDRAAFDQSNDLVLEKTIVTPDSATDHHGRNVAGLLATADRDYFTQEEVGDRAHILYKSPTKMDEERTVFLRSTGYYTYKRDYQGTPDFSELRKFREPGHFTAFAESEYQELFRTIIARKTEIASRNETH